MQINFSVTKRQPPWSRNSLRYKFRYLENQENYFIQKGLMCSVFKKLSHEIILYQQPCSPLLEMLPCILFNFYTLILFMELKDLHAQVMVKNEIDNIPNGPKNDKWANYLCQLEHLCGCKFPLSPGTEICKI